MWTSGIGRSTNVGHWTAGVGHHGSGGGKVVGYWAKVWASGIGRSIIVGSLASDGRREH